MVPVAFPAAELGLIPTYLTDDEVTREIAARTAALVAVRQLEVVASEAHRLANDLRVVRSGTQTNLTRQGTAEVTESPLDVQLALAKAAAWLEQVETAQSEFERARAASPVASRDCIESEALGILGDEEGEGCWWVGAAIALAGAGASALAAAAAYICPGAILAGPVAVAACLSAVGTLFVAMSALAALIQQHSSCYSERRSAGQIACDELWENMLTVTQLYPDFSESVEFSDLITAWIFLNCEELVGGAF